MNLAEFQKLIDDTYGERDRARGLPRTYMWFSEEVGELCRALHRDTGEENLKKEFADVLAWLTTLASAKGVDLNAAAMDVYGKGCPDCGGIPCKCR